MLRVENVSADYGERSVLRDVSLGVRAGELVSVLGPSGSGKTTLLRVIAGLEHPSQGRVLWDDRDLWNVPVHERGFGLMFQDFALFPHRDVGANVAFGLRMRGDSGGETQRRVGEMLTLVGLAGMERRSVSSLSGGERQRVALSRTLAPAPVLMMLDEPLGSLDRELRERLPGELRKILRSVGAAVVYVTHDQEEALAIADRTIVLLDGRIAADGPPEELWSRPPSASVARFLGFRNLARVPVERGLAVSPWGALQISDSVANGQHWLMIRPDAFLPDADGAVRGRVAARLFRGDHARLEVHMNGAPALEIDARWSPLPAVGEELILAVDPGRIVVIPGPIDAPPGASERTVRVTA